MKFNSYIKEHQIFEEVKQMLTELALDQAIEFAEQMHKGQFRKGDGKPYVVHPKAVYSILPRPSKSAGISVFPVSSFILQMM